MSLRSLLWHLVLPEAREKVTWNIRTLGWPAAPAYPWQWAQCPGRNWSGFSSGWGFGRAVFVFLLAFYQYKILSLVICKTYMCAWLMLKSLWFSNSPICTWLMYWICLQRSTRGKVTNDKTSSCSSQAEGSWFMRFLWQCCKHQCPHRAGYWGPWSEHAVLHCICPIRHGMRCTHWALWDLPSGWTPQAEAAFVQTEMVRGGGAPVGRSSGLLLKQQDADIIMRMVLLCFIKDLIPLAFLCLCMAACIFFLSYCIL